MAQTYGSSRSDGGTLASADHALTITRVFKAPVLRVFQAWTERDRIREWMGPHGFTTTLFESDARPGGAWRARMRGPDGQELGQHGLVRALSPPRLFAFTQQWEDEGSLETLVTIGFSERGGRTTMRFQQGDFDTSEARNSHEEGWSESFDRLEAYLKRTEAER
jgi:uncharacterized protein YndB with AHSA1/START domain